MSTRGPVLPGNRHGRNLGSRKLSGSISRVHFPLSVPYVPSRFCIFIPGPSNDPFPAKLTIPVRPTFSPAGAPLPIVQALTHQ